MQMDWGDTSCICVGRHGTRFFDEITERHDLILASVYVPHIYFYKDQNDRSNPVFRTNALSFSPRKY